MRIAFKRIPDGLQSIFLFLLRYSSFEIEIVLKVPLLRFSLAPENLACYSFALTHEVQ